jgi:hypothetical protein
VGLTDSHRPADRLEVAAGREGPPGSAQDEDAEAGVDGGALQATKDRDGHFAVEGVQSFGRVDGQPGHMAAEVVANAIIHLCSIGHVWITFSRVLVPTGSFR